MLTWPLMTFLMQDDAEVDPGPNHQPAQGILKLLVRSPRATIVGQT